MSSWFKLHGFTMDKLPLIQYSLDAPSLTLQRTEIYRVICQDLILGRHWLSIGINFFILQRMGFLFVPDIWIPIYLMDLDLPYNRGTTTVFDFPTPSKGSELSSYAECDTQDLEALCSAITNLRASRGWRPRLVRGLPILVTCASLLDDQFSTVRSSCSSSSSLVS